MVIIYCIEYYTVYMYMWLTQCQVSNKLAVLIYINTNIDYCFEVNIFCTGASK